jgi:serine/threonine protein phosphatase PrpC
MKLTYAELSSQGPVRAKNEDCVGFWQPADLEEDRTRGTVAALADGVGGHGHGDVASRLAIEVALGTFQAVKPGTPPRQTLERMFRAANLAVYDQGMDHREMGRMATTLTIALFRNNEITVGHVGDTRAYVIQEGRIRQVTADHSYAAQQHKLGLISEQEAATSELRSLLTRSLGREPIVQVDCYTVSVNRGDRLIQCSDGLYTCITAQELCEIATHATPHEACHALVALAEKRGTDDNLSVQIVHIHRVEQLLYYRGLPIYQEPEPPMSNEIEVGQVLDGRFQISGVICRSGMASIFKAKDMETGKVVAVKVPLMQFESDPAFFSRFQREEEIGKVLRHPYLLHIEPVAEKSRPFIVMEFLEGQTLRQLLTSHGRLPIEHALTIARQVAEALDYMHQQKVIHRDLKPENVMLCKDGSLRIMDFGIAKAAAMRRITFTGFSPTMGTPDYMAPEQVKGKRGDERTDIYSLGAMLYEMLTGVPPFEGNSPYMIMNARLVGDPVAPRKRNPEISPQVEEIILHALERNPHDRYPSAAALKADLDHPEAVQVTGRHARLRPPVLWRTGWRMARLIIGAMLVPVVVFGLMYLFLRRY